jgi:hypothetical protein
MIMAAAVLATVDVTTLVALVLVIFVMVVVK